MSGDEFAARITGLGITQTGLARLMVRLGDERPPKNVLRSIQRMRAGDSRVSGEMRALLGLLERAPDLARELARPERQPTRSAA